MLEMSEFASRRKRIMERLDAKDIMILPSAPIQQRNGDYDYPYRQNSDFYYVTGFEEPNAIAILAPHHAKGDFILFNQTRNREEELWTGPRAGQDGAKALYGANDAFPFAEFEAQLPEICAGRKNIHYSLGLNPHCDHIVLRTLNKMRGKIRAGLQPPLTFIDLTDTLHELRLIKSAHEIKLMKKAAEISAWAHIQAIKICKPDLYEYELEAEIAYLFQKNGARFPAYTSIIGSGENSCILHYVNNNQRIKKNDIVLIDAGAEYQNYAADLTRTFPANGRFSPEQKAVYEIVLAAQKAGIQTIKPGASFIAAQEKMVEIITEGLIDLGILKGNRTELIEKQAYFPFYMHKSGHWLGLDVHDVGRYKINGEWRSLETNMVLTIEPGIYISQVLSEVDKRWHGIGVRIEDDILVTAQGNEILTQAAPKELKDIEDLMAH